MKKFNIGDRVKIVGKSAWKDEQGVITRIIERNNAYVVHVGILQVAFFEEELELI